MNKESLIMFLVFIIAITILGFISIKIDKHCADKGGVAIITQFGTSCIKKENVLWTN